MLVRRILPTHRQPLVGAAVGPAEDGPSNHLAAVRGPPGLGGADVVCRRVGVALLVAPDALGGRAAVVG